MELNTLLKIFISRQVSCISYRAAHCLGAIDIYIAQVASLGSLSYNGANGTTLTRKGPCSVLNHFISTSPRHQIDVINFLVSGDFDLFSSLVPNSL